jgi:hypothetical protein
MYYDKEVTLEEEEKMIEQLAKRIHKTGFDWIALILLEGAKPLSFIGSQMGLYYVSPVLPVLDENLGLVGDKFFKIFEKRENVEKLIIKIEELKQDEKNEDVIVRDFKKIYNRIKKRIKNILYR